LTVLVSVFMFIGRVGGAPGLGLSAEYPFQPSVMSTWSHRPLAIAIAAFCSAVVGLAPPICTVAA